VKKVVRKYRWKNKREPEDAWPPPNLKNFRKGNPEPYRKKDGTVVYLIPPKRIVRLIVHKPTVEELLGLKKPEE
jgi:hypothetical protein